MCYGLLRQRTKRQSARFGWLLAGAGIGQLVYWEPIIDGYKVQIFKSSSSRLQVNNIPHAAYILIADL